MAANILTLLELLTLTKLKEQPPLGSKPEGSLSFLTHGSTVQLHFQRIPPSPMCVKQTTSSFHMLISTSMFFPRAEIHSSVS